MNEFASRRPYSAAARKVTEVFTASAEDFNEYVRRGLIATNNLGLRMQVFEAGPDSVLWIFHSRALLSPQICRRLQRARDLEPELWQTSVAAYKYRTEIGAEYATVRQQYGADNSVTSDLLQQADDAMWHDIELRSKVFEVIEQELLSEDEAIALCR